MPETTKKIDVADLAEVVSAAINRTLSTQSTGETIILKHRIICGIIFEPSHSETLPSIGSDT